MKITNDNDWNRIARRLVGEDEADAAGKPDSGLSAEDAALVDIIGRIRLDCDYERAFAIKDEVNEKIYNKIFADNEKQKSPFTARPYAVLLAVAASLALLMLITNLYHFRGKAGNGEIFTTEFSSPSDISTVVLPDSSIVTLNAGSVLAYDTDYNLRERRVSLKGEACFDVRHNPEKPFIVETEKINVKVLGTVFDVSAYQDDKEIVTSLVSGSVEITDLQDEPICRLRPNQAAHYNKSTSEAEIVSYEAEYALAWMSGKLLFKKAAFEDICRALERKFECTISIENKVIMSKVFTGRFENDETLPQIFKIIQINFPFRYKIVQDSVTIY